MKFAESDFLQHIEFKFTKNFKKGEIVRDKIDGKDCVGTVLNGSLGVFSISLEGKEVNLKTLEVGDCFGVSNLFLQGSLQTTLVAKKATEIEYVLKDDVIKAMENDANFAIKYASYCNEKIQFLLEKIEFLSIQTSKNKLISYLLVHMNDQKQVKIDCTREELAARLGVSRAQLFREIASLQKQGAIEIHKDFFEIKDKIKQIKICE